MLKHNKIKSSLLAADRLAESYGLRKVSEMAIDKRVLKRVVRDHHDAEVWTDCFMSPIISVRPYFGLITKVHMKWDKMKSKAMIAVRTGSLKFSNSWKIYNCKHGLRVRCINRMCNGIDELSHAKVCKFYFTKWEEKFADSDDEMANYIIALNRERLRRFRMPIL